MRVSIEHSNTVVRLPPLMCLGCLASTQNANAPRRCLCIGLWIKPFGTVPEQTISLQFFTGVRKNLGLLSCGWKIGANSIGLIEEGGDIQYFCKNNCNFNKNMLKYVMSTASCVIQWSHNWLFTFSNEEV